MKPVIIMISIIIIVVGGGIWSLNYISNTADMLISIADEVENKVNEEKWDEALEKMQDFQNQWESVKQIWTIMLDHNKVYAIEISIVSILEYLNVEEIKDVLAEIKVLKRQILQIVEREEFTLPNIL